MLSHDYTPSLDTVDRTEDVQTIQMLRQRRLSEPSSPWERHGVFSMGFLCQGVMETL
ncbi:MAG: hypothetical protein QW420_02920 [Candidatus Caldarchaeum sp.]